MCMCAFEPMCAYRLLLMYVVYVCMSLYLTEVSTICYHFYLFFIL